MKITIKLSETNNALLNRVVKEEKVDASEFANSAFLDKFLPVSEKLGIEAGFILQEHEAGTLDAWLVKQCISRGIRWLGKHPIRDCAILKQILVRFPFSAKDNGKISTCNECVQSDMDSVVALLKERVPGYVPSKDEYNGLVEDVLANWEYIWDEAIVYNVLATIVYTNEPNFKFNVLLGCKDTETQEYFSKMIGEKHTLLAADTSQKPQPIIKPADLAHLEQDLIVICDDGAMRLRKNFYFK